MCLSFDRFDLLYYIREFIYRQIQNVCTIARERLSESKDWWIIKFVWLINLGSFSWISRLALVFVSFSFRRTGTAYAINVFPRRPIFIHAPHVRLYYFLPSFSSAPCLVRSFETRDFARRSCLRARTSSPDVASRRVVARFLAAFSLSSRNSRRITLRRNARRRNWLPTLLKSRSYSQQKHFHEQATKRTNLLISIALYGSLSLYLPLEKNKKKTKKR